MPGRRQLFEPGLDGLIQQGLQSGALTSPGLSSPLSTAADLIWVTFDTLLTMMMLLDAEYVLDRVRLIFPYLKTGSVVLISSQVPVGSTARLEQEFSTVADGRDVSFAYSPENLRLGDAIRVFTEPERIVIGIRSDHARKVIEPMLQPFCPTLLWTRVDPRDGKACALIPISLPALPH